MQDGRLRPPQISIKTGYLGEVSSFKNFLGPIVYEEEFSTSGLHYFADQGTISFDPALSGTNEDGFSANCSCKKSKNARDLLRPEVLL